MTMSRLTKACIVGLSAMILLAPHIQKQFVYTRMSLKSKLCDQSLLSYQLTGQSSSAQHSVLQADVVVGSGVGVVGLMQFPSSLQKYPS